MKSICLISACIFLTAFALAQPADAEIKQRAISAGATATKFTTEKGTIHTTITEKWYMRTIESKWNTDYPEIKRWERNEYRYNFVGGKWVFSRSYQNSSWFDGIPNPTEAEIRQLLESSKVGYQYAVLQKPVFSLAKEPKWNWHTYNSVEFMVVAVFYEKSSTTEVVKKKITFPLRLYRDTGGGLHDPNTKKYFKDAPWLSIHKPVISSSYGEEEVLERKQYTAEETEKIKTMNELAGESEAGERLQSLGTLDIPAFKTDKEAIVWIHRIMLEADVRKIELMLFKMLASHHFEDGSSVVMNDGAKTLLDNLKKAAKIYGTLYCENPSIKHEQDNMMQFYDRETQSHARIALTLEKDNFKINDIDCLYEASSDKLARCRSAGETNCGKPIDTKAASAPDKFNPGDWVTVNWNGQNKVFYNGKITKTDPYNENRYFIEFETIQSAWIDAKYISKRKGK